MLHTMNDAPYHPTSRIESNWAVITGTAVAIRLKFYNFGIVKIVALLVRTYEKKNRYAKA